jgi:hypothetical protein
MRYVLCSLVDSDQYSNTVCDAGRRLQSQFGSIAPDVEEDVLITEVSSNCLDGVRFPSA